MLIIAADDFGYSEGVNNAIATAFEEGLISSTTIMANAPAFEHACSLAKKNGFSHKVGIHLNITEGIPLTAEIRKSRIFCNEEGEFCFRRFSHYWLPLNEVALLRNEISEQIIRCRAYGLQITHADSHHHVHTEFIISLTVAGMLRKFNIPYLRLTDNVRDTSFLRKTYKSNLNLLIGLYGLRGTNYFCDLSNISKMKKQCGASDVVVELMVHPVFTDEGDLIDAGLGKSLSASVGEIPNSTELISFNEVKTYLA
jgi:predicted glycoside hydrolase/deacetylase ChbG (UPF0249 family)